MSSITAVTITTIGVVLWTAYSYLSKPIVERILRTIVITITTIGVVF